MAPQPLTAAERVAQLIKSLDITPYQFAKETGLSHQTISNVLTGKNRPSLDTLESIAGRYPDTAIWLLTGAGQPRTGYVPAPATPAPAAVEEPRVAFAPTVPSADVVTAFLGQMAEVAAAHREEVRHLKAEARADLRAQAETYTYTIDRMADDFKREREDLKAKIAALELRFGLRVPTEEEQRVIERQEEQAKAKAKETNPIGFGKVQPQAVEMHASPGGLHEQSFQWLPTADADAPMWLSHDERKQAA